MVSVNVAKVPPPAELGEQATLPAATSTLAASGTQRVMYGTWATFGHQTWSLRDDDVVNFATVRHWSL